MPYLNISFSLKPNFSIKYMKFSSISIKFLSKKVSGVMEYALVELMYSQLD